MMRSLKMELHFEINNDLKSIRVVNEPDYVLSSDQRIIIYICNYMLENYLSACKLTLVKIENKCYNVENKVNAILELTKED